MLECGSQQNWNYNVVNMSDDVSSLYMWTTLSVIYTKFNQHKRDMLVTAVINIHLLLWWPTKTPERGILKDTSVFIVWYEWRDETVISDKSVHN